MPRGDDETIGLGGGDAGPGGMRRLVECAHHRALRVTDDASAPPASTTTTSTTTVPAGCPAAAPVSSGVTVTAIEAVEIDGDTVLDTMATYLEGEEWHLLVDVGAGGSTDVVVPDVSPVTGAVGMGGFDIEGDGAEELLRESTPGPTRRSSPSATSTVARRGPSPSTVSPQSSAWGRRSGTSPGRPATAPCCGRSGGNLVEGTEGTYEVIELPSTLEGHVLTQGFGDGAVVTLEGFGPLLSCGDVEVP